MTNLESIRNADPINLAKFLHAIEAGALIEGRADTEDRLLVWLFEEKEEEKE